MGKPTGFIEYLRELPVDRTPTERVRDWSEFHHHMEEKHLRQQGAAEVRQIDAHRTERGHVGARRLPQCGRGCGHLGQPFGRREPTAAGDGRAGVQNVEGQIVLLQRRRL